MDECAHLCVQGQVPDYILDVVASAVQHGVPLCAPGGPAERQCVGLWG